MPNLSREEWKITNAPKALVPSSTPVVVALSLSSDAGRSDEGNQSTTLDVVRHSYRVGLSGGGATIMSVFTMMWLHTIVTYQQRHGTTFNETARQLWRDGGPRRFYRGLLPSLAVAPICRFGDTLCNELAVTLLQAEPAGTGGQKGWRAVGNPGLPVWVSTLFGSVGAAAFHASVVPLDTYKVILQVEGKRAFAVMKDRVAQRGTPALYDGALAFAGGSFMGHYPWYLTYNVLENYIPRAPPDNARRRQLRSAFIGTVASAVSATASNFFRVLKVYRQAHQRPEGLSYQESVLQIMDRDGGGARGALGVFGRGLSGRVAASGVQGLVFNVVWKEISHWSESRSER